MCTGGNLAEGPQGPGEFCGLCVPVRPCSAWRPLGRSSGRLSLFPHEAGATETQECRRLHGGPDKSGLVLSHVHPQPSAERRGRSAGVGGQGSESRGAARTQRPSRSLLLPAALPPNIVSGLATEQQVGFLRKWSHRGGLPIVPVWPVMLCWRQAPHWPPACPSLPSTCSPTPRWPDAPLPAYQLGSAGPCP